MSTSGVILNVRMDAQTKEDATQALKAMGLTPSVIVRMLMTRIAKEKQLPFEIKIPNATTVRAMKEADEIIKNRATRFNSAEDLFNDLEKTAKNKRANPPRDVDRTKDFIKDWIRLEHSGRYDMRRLKEVMMLLIANDEPLGAEYLDHPLSGNWIGHRECHVGGDFLLIYRLDATEKMVVFLRAGTHSELFK